jgi:hypothetical protein
MGRDGGAAHLVVSNVMFSVIVGIRVSQVRSMA